MKKILVTTIVASAVVVSALAQGNLTFSAARDTIKWTDGIAAPVSVTAGNPAQVSTYGKLNVALYANTVTTTLSLKGGVPDLTGWSMGMDALGANLILSQIAPFAGQIPNKTVYIPASLSGANGGTDVRLEVVAWTGNFATFADAVADGKGLFAWSGDQRSGGSFSWVQPTGTVAPPTSVFVPAGVFNGLVLAPIPEPSTFALAGLGAAALLIFRRRK